MGPEFLSAEEVCTLHLARPNPVGVTGPERVEVHSSVWMGGGEGRGRWAVAARALRLRLAGSAPAPCSFVRLRTILALFPASLLPLGPAEVCSERAYEHAEC